MKRSSTTVLAAAGIAAGLISIALPASAALADVPAPHAVLTTKAPSPVLTTKAPSPVLTTKAPSAGSTSPAGSPAGLPDFTKFKSTTSQVVSGGPNAFDSSSKTEKSIQDVTYTYKRVDGSKCGPRVKVCYETDGFVRDYADKGGRKGSFEGYTPFTVFSSQPPCHTPPKKVRGKNTKNWLEGYFKPHTHFCHVVLSKCHPAPHHFKPRPKPHQHPTPHQHAKPKQQCGCKK